MAEECRAGTASDQIRSSGYNIHAPPGLKTGWRFKVAQCPPASTLALSAKTWNDGGREVATATHDKIDWLECSLVEIKQGVQSGAPVLRGARMPVSGIVDNFDYGLSVAASCR